MENKEGTVKLKFFNVTYQCGRCKKHYNVKDHVPYVVTQIIGFQPIRGARDPQFQPMMGSLMLCPDCFKEMKLVEEESKIVIPKTNNINFSKDFPQRIN